MTKYYGMPNKEKYECRECGSIKYGNYFISPTLCKKCAAKRRPTISNVPVQVTEELIVTETVYKRLSKEAVADNPRTTIDSILEDTVQRFIGLPFWVSAFFIAHAIFEGFSAIYWIFIFAWCLPLPMIIDRLIDAIMAKPRKERMARISEGIRELAELRKERIEQQKQSGLNISDNLDSEETGPHDPKDLLSCPKCKKQALFWNSKYDIYECLNEKCGECFEGHFIDKNIPISAKPSGLLTILLKKILRL